MRFPLGVMHLYSKPPCHHCYALGMLARNHMSATPIGTMVKLGQLGHQCNSEIESTVKIMIARCVGVRNIPNYR